MSNCLAWSFPREIRNGVENSYNANSCCIICCLEKGSYLWKLKRSVQLGKKWIYNQELIPIFQALTWILDTPLSTLNWTFEGPFSVVRTQKNVFALIPAHFLHKFLLLRCSRFGFRVWWHRGSLYLHLCNKKCLIAFGVLRVNCTMWCAFQVSLTPWSI